ncbi:MAG: SDR family oxidoreductase [Oscillospiraceae bacterium]|nr:SDR family oxidoreductase [Oscillospiraceae bacterium]
MGNLKKHVKSLIQLFKSEKIQPIIVPTDSRKLLDGKIVLISGGTGGIGFAIAKHFLDSGAKIILLGRSEDRLKKSVQDLTGENNVKYIVADASNVQILEQQVQTAASLFSEDKIDILVNAAGMIGKSDFLHTDEAEYDSIMDVNAKGTFFLTQATAKLMISKKIKGHILNISSSSALRPAWGPYHMSKWAVRGFTIGAADVLLPYGIVVNAIGPGPTATKMLGKEDGDSIYNSTNPSGRYATPEEIASLALFMVSGAGDMIVGDTFYMTGGSGITSLHK